MKLKANITSYDFRRGARKDMSLPDKIKAASQDLEYKIRYYEQAIEKTKLKVNQINSEYEVIKKYCEKYPDLTIDNRNNVLCAASIIKDLTSCNILIDYYGLYITFSKQIDESSRSRIFLNPYKVKFAEVSRPYNYLNSKIDAPNIKVSDFNDIVSSSNPLKQQAIKKMKKAVVRYANKNKIQVSQDSYEYDYFCDMLNFS